MKDEGRVWREWAMIVDPALRKLLRLRLRATLRRMLRNLKTVRGVVFSLLGALVMAGWIVPNLVTAGSVRDQMDPEAVRAAVPLGLLAICLLSVFTSGPQRGVHFTAAEIDFLFSGPFTRRELLLYKLASSAAGAVLVALLFSAVFVQYTKLWIAGFVGIWLALMLVQLSSTAIVLVGQTLAEHAYTRARRLVFLAAIVVVGLGLWAASLGAGGGGVIQVLRRFHDSWFGMVLLAPFDVFGRTITAQTIVPELVGWGALALSVDLALLALVLRLDVNYMESAIAVSRKLYQRVQRMRRSGGVVWTGKTTARLRVPNLPRLGGAGPVIRKQLIHAVRSAPGVLVFLIAIAFPLCVMTFSVRGGPSGAPAGVLGMVLAFMTIMLTRMLPFDFRGDIDQMDWLKSLPLPSAAIAAGQLVVPALIMTGIHLLILGGAALFMKEAGIILAVIAAFALPFNFLVFSLENLLFLLFPARVMPSTPGDVQHMGRAMVEILVKMLVLALCCGVSGGLGAVAYLVAGSWIAAVSGSWLVLAAMGATFVPLIAAAYRRFDVSVDTPP